MARFWIGLGTTTLILFGVVGTGGSQATNAGQPAGAGKAERDARYFSDGELRKSCLICHASKQHEKDTLSLLNEVPIWQGHDLHRQACEALTSPLGEQMSKRLYGDPKVAAKKAECLVCHSTDSAPGAPLSAAIPDRFGCEMGINCQACHGPAKKWEQDHRFDKWRTLNGNEKLKEFGLVDLRNARGRAEKCVSCHVGSAAEYKFVTHEMYAAGHPPLPAFELATFSRDEPMHWRRPADVKHIADLAAKDAAKAKALFSYHKGENESARLAAVGAVVSLRESVQLLTFDADPMKPAERLDFAHFNCAACHHDLRVPSQRQASGFPGIPGRPVPQTWPTWGVHAVLRHLETSQAQGSKAKEVKEEFEKSYKELRDAFDMVPFGDRKTVGERVERVKKACDAILALLDSTDFTEPQARGLLASLSQEGHEALTPRAARRDYLDADGATQLARAVAAIALEFEGLPKPTIDGNPPTSAPTFEMGPAPLKRLHQALGLSVRDLYQNKDLLQIDGSLIKRNERAARYESNPATARDAFRDLLKLK